jgi:5-methylcytosine-specific restriction endonuclease McrA
MPKKIKRFIRVFVESPHISSVAASVLLRRQLIDADSTRGWRQRVRWRDGIVQQIVDACLPLTCEFCGRSNLIPFPEHGDKRALTLDHFIPHSKSKDDRLSNLVIACVKCNSEKSDRLPTAEEISKVRTIEFLLNSAGQLKTI